VRAWVPHARINAMPQPLVPSCGSWASRQASPGAGLEPAWQEPGQREAGSQQPHTWLANAGSCGGVPGLERPPASIYPLSALRPAALILTRLTILPPARPLESVWVASPLSTKLAIMLTSKPSVVSIGCVIPSRPAIASMARTQRCSSVRRSERNIVGHSTPAVPHGHAQSPPSSKSPIVAGDCHTDEQCENRCRFVASHFAASKSMVW
jgi:hypothetical protein